MDRFTPHLYSLLYLALNSLSKSHFQSNFSLTTHYGFSAIKIAPATIMSPAMNFLKIPLSLRNVPDRIIVNKIFKDTIAVTKATLPVLTAFVPANR